MAKEIKVWGEGRKGLRSFGTTVDIPDGYVEVPSGGTFVTRTIKKLAGTVYVRMKRIKKKNFSNAISVLAPRAVVEAAQVEAVRTEEARSKQRKVAAAQRVKEAKLRAEIVAKMLAMYPKMPKDEAEQVADHAFEVRSGRVGRTSSVEMKKKIELAVQAYARHTHTKYDDLLNSGWDREAARQEVAGDIERVLRRWRETGL